MKQPKPRAWFDDDQPFCPPLVVYEESPQAIDTGLLDANGTKIFRRPAIGAIGFNLTKGSR